MASLVIVDKYQAGEEAGERGAVIRYIKCHAREVVESREWMDLMETNPELVNDVVRVLIN